MIVRNVAPVLAVAEIDEARAFLHDRLWFDGSLRTEGCAFRRRDGGAVGPIGAARHADMDDARPPGRLRATFDRAHGQRALHAIHGPFLSMAGRLVTGSLVTGNAAGSVDGPDGARKGGAP